MKKAIFSKKTPSPKKSADIPITNCPERDRPLNSNDSTKQISNLPAGTAANSVEPESPPDKREGNGESEFLNYFSDPDRMSHDIHLEHVTGDRYWSAKEFIRACKAVGVYRLKQGELSDDAGHHLAFLGRELAESIRVLIGQGDLQLARQLPPIVEILQNALKTYGSKITSRAKKRHSIDQILKKHKAGDLLAMLSALHPDWHSWLLHIYHHRIRKLPAEIRDEILLRKRRKMESFPEDRLCAYILGKECFVSWNDGKRVEEWRPHGLAEILENVFAVREGENENINLFVENLWHGRLWGLGNDKTGSKTGMTYVKAEWKGKKDLPERDDVRAWMKLVMLFLKEQTEGDAMRLNVFEHMLAARRSVFAGERLADDKPEYIWNQVENRIRKAWVTMAKRASKRNSSKSA